MQNYQLKNAIFNGDDKMAMEIIKNNNYDPNYTDSDGNTYLLMACLYGLSNIALELIKTGKFKIDHINNIYETALMYACQCDNLDVVIALIKTGNSIPDYQHHNETALIWSCLKKHSAIALELIKSGQSKPEAVDQYGCTALIRACINGMSDVALELIKTGNSNPFTVGILPNSDALYFARARKMLKVETELLKLTVLNKYYIDLFKIQHITTNINNMLLELINSDDINIQVDLLLKTIPELLPSEIFIQQPVEVEYLDI